MLTSQQIKNHRLSRKAANIVRARRERLEWLLRHACWNVGIVDAPIETFLEPGARPPVKWLPETPRGTFLADPFMVETDEGFVIFAEMLKYTNRRGHIAALAVSDDGDFGPPTTAISAPFHLSYPYLIRHDGHLYCVPETGEAGEVILYEAVDFPNRWKRRATIIADFAALDTSIFRHDGRWWLFCSEQDGTRGVTLHAWHAPDLLGPWEPHAANPIKRDLGSARPAGSVFVHDGQLYRPGQDNTKTYGGAVVIHRVSRLTPDEFAEEEVSRVEPYTDGPYRYGLHTLTACGRHTLIDGKRYRFVPAEFRNRMPESFPMFWNK